MRKPQDLSIRHRSLAEMRRPVAEAGDVDRDVERAIGRMLLLVCRSGYPALSGPQVGLDRRVIVADLSRTGRRPVVLVDPVVEAVAGEQQVETEGCLELPGMTVRVRRPVQITVRGRARSGQVVRMEAGGLLARILQHHLDHLQGIPILDRATALERRLLRERTGGSFPSCRLGPVPPEDCSDLSELEVSARVG